MVMMHAAHAKRPDAQLAGGSNGNGTRNVAADHMIDPAVEPGHFNSLAAQDRAHQPAIVTPGQHGIAARIGCQAQYGTIMRGNAGQRRASPIPVPNPAVAQTNHQDIANERQAGHRRINIQLPIGARGRRCGHAATQALNSAASAA